MLDVAAARSDMSPLIYYNQSHIYCHNFIKIIENFLPESLISFSFHYYSILCLRLGKSF